MNPLTAPLHLPLVPSRRVAWAVTAAHLIAVGLAILGLPQRVPMLAFAGAILASLGHFYRHRARLHRDYVALLFHTDGALTVLTRTAGPQAARLAPERLVSAWLTVLVVETGARRLHVALTVDNTEPARFRRLRVRLLHPPPRFSR